MEDSFLKVALKNVFYRCVVIRRAFKFFFRKKPSRYIPPGYCGKCFEKFVKSHEDKKNSTRLLRRILPQCARPEEEERDTSETLVVQNDGCRDRVIRVKSDFFFRVIVSKLD